MSMNKSVLYWLLPLILAFLGAAALDRYFEHSRQSAEGAAPEAKEVSFADFMAAAGRGEMKEGRIVYRAHMNNVADLEAVQSVATGSAAAASTPVRTTARLTEEDLKFLRGHQFAEGDQSVARKNAPASAGREYMATLAKGATQVLGILLVISLAVMTVQALMAKSSSFASANLQAATSDVKFSSVAGCNEAKEEVSEVVEYLKDSTRFKAAGGRMPKGVLLVGPPGTGKTMLAKAVAGEANAKFYSLSGSDFVELYVGVGASRVRSLFKKARENAPSIIFIDELDAVGRQRASGPSGHQEHEQTLNALLVAMDGFESSDAVVVFGATNRPEIMDKALLRPGRFDRQVFVGLPDVKGRLDILKVHSGRIKLEDSVKLEEVAKATSGFSGADLANLVNEGALHAARARRTTVMMSDFEEARDKISWGRENRRTMTDADKKIIAYHEAGHALMQVLSGDELFKLHKVTIIPRGQSLGSTQFTPERDLLNYSKDQLIARIWCLMAGRVAEELALGNITSGASGDIQQASQIARQMVFEWGMSPLGFLALAKPGGEELLTSQATFHEAEKYMRELLEKQYQFTTETLGKHRIELDAIATALLERETITGEEVRAMCRDQALTAS